MALGKARVQLIDETTGAVVEEVDVFSDASLIAYINKNPLANAVGSLPRGTTFREEDKKSVADVLDAILYPGAAAKLPSITDSEGNEVTEDTVIYVEKFTQVRPHYVTCLVASGDRAEVTISLKINNLMDGTTKSIDRRVRITPGTSYLYQEEVTAITNDTSIQLTITDGTNLITSPIIEYRFIYPVFVGYCDLTQFIDSSGVEFDIPKATQYLNTLIRNDSYMIHKHVVPMQDINSFAIDNAAYDDVKANLCIMYPNSTWQKITAIMDGSGNNITSAFINGPVGIKPDPSVSSDVQYSCYVSKRQYSVITNTTKSVVYKFDGSGSTDTPGDGSSLLSGFDIMDSIPVDNRSVVQTYEDLASMLFPYEGLITYVVKEHTHFKYYNEEWVPTNQTVHFQTTGGEPSIDIGGWDDIMIDTSTGKFYKKYQNLRWELQGQMTSSIAAWQQAAYAKDSKVIHDDKHWIAIQDTEAEPGSNYEWKCLD